MNKHQEHLLKVLDVERPDRVSISLTQRKCQVGYNMAREILDSLVELGELKKHEAIAPYGHEHWTRDYNEKR